VDAVIAWHPGGETVVGAGSCLAIKRARFRFHGMAAHAAGNPEKGRSALDAVELMNVGVNYLREHVTSETRIHYVITKGGGRPNVVPEEAEAWYYVRAPKMAEAIETFARVSEVAQGACLMTRTKVEVRDESGTYEILPNMALVNVMHRHLKRVGPPAFDAADQRFAAEVRRNLGVAAPEEWALARDVSDISFRRTMGSTDVGDVSYTVPTVEFAVACRALGVPGHSWGFVACAGGPIGHKGSRVAAKAMASAGLELLTTPERVREAREEFQKRTKDFRYRSGIPAEQKPPEKIDD
jgi:aminobenzoyl-glutamate utilization protein B